MLIGFGLLQFKLFDIIPFARDKVIGNLNEGILVLNSQDRIVDFNAKLKEIVNTGLQKQINIGMDYRDLFSFYEELLNIVINRVTKKIETQIKDKTYELNISPLFDKSTIYSGVVINHRYITEKKAQELLIK